MALTKEEKYTLLKVARASLETLVNKGPGMEIDASKGLAEDSGAFVSLHKGGALRGCIGTFASPAPLYRTVADMAVAAASKDPRFVPVEPDELPDVKIEISVISPLREIKNVEEIEVGRHGIYITKGRNRGVLLPQVAIAHGFDKYEFLDQTCIKAGLAAGSWRPYERRDPRIHCRPVHHTVWRWSIHHKR